MTIRPHFQLLWPFFSIFILFRIFIFRVIPSNEKYCRSYKIRRKFCQIHKISGLLPILFRLNVYHWTSANFAERAEAEWNEMDEQSPCSFSDMVFVLFLQQERKKHSHKRELTDFSDFYWQYYWISSSLLFIFFNQIQSTLNILDLWYFSPTLNQIK